MWSPPNYYIIICETKMNQYLEGKIKFKRFFQGPQRLSETQISCSGHDKMKYRFGINIGSVIIIQRRYLPIGWICSWQIRCNRFLLTGIFFLTWINENAEGKGMFWWWIVGFLLQRRTTSQMIQSWWDCSNFFGDGNPMESLKMKGKLTKRWVRDL